MGKKYRQKLALWILSVFLLSALLPGCGTGNTPEKETASLRETAMSAALQADGGTEEAYPAKAPETDAVQNDGTEPAAAAESPDAETGQSGQAKIDGQSAGEDPQDGSGLQAEREIPKAEGEIPEDGSYTSRDDVALYLYTYGHLPDNFITKNEAKKLGWDNSKGNLAEVAPGKSIGGDRFGNYEGLLPEGDGRKWLECDIGYEEGYRNGERIVFSNDGLIYYTGDHYKSFERLY